VNDLSGISFGAQIAQAARAHQLDPAFLAAVAAQETGGPGSDSGRNVTGDGGHGHGLFQIDDRYHDFARTPAASDPAQNADYAAGMIRGLLDRYGGDERRALSAYNAGSPSAQGTVTTWGDGRRLGYADSVLRHYSEIASRADARDTLVAARPDDAASAYALSDAYAASVQVTPPLPATPVRTAAAPLPATDAASATLEALSAFSGSSTACTIGTSSGSAAGTSSTGTTGTAANAQQPDGDAGLDRRLAALTNPLDEDAGDGV
jgi:hypothetical protein